MVTVHGEAGLRFVIYTDDHEPAHVHVLGNGEAKIAITGARGAPELIRSSGMKSGELRRAMRVVAERQDYLLERWREFHG